MAINFNKKIEYLNRAFQHFKDGLSLIKAHGYKTSDMDTYFWRVEKAVRELDKEILKELKKEMNDIEFNHIVKNFKKKEKR